MPENANTTHPNAYRAEAQEKRTLIAQLASEANALDEKADALEGVTKTPVIVEAPQTQSKFK